AVGPRSLAAVRRDAYEGLHVEGADSGREAALGRVDVVGQADEQGAERVPVPGPVLIEAADQLRPGPGQLVDEAEERRGALPLGQVVDLLAGGRTGHVQDLESRRRLSFL